MRLFLGLPDILIVYYPKARSDYEGLDIIAQTPEP